MTEKETLIGARADTATSMAGFRGVGFGNNQHRHTFPGCLIFDELRQLVVGHIRNNAVHPLAFGFLPDTLEVSQHDSRASFFGFIHYLSANLVAGIVHLTLLSMPDFLNSVDKFPLPKPLSQSCVVPTYPPNFLAEELGLNIITATDGGQVSFPKVYSKETARIDNRFTHFSLNCQVDKPDVLSSNELGFPQRAIIRNRAVGLEPQPDATSDPEAWKLEPVRSDISIMPLKPDDIAAQDKRVVSMFRGLNLLNEPLRLLPSSRIEVFSLTMNSPLEVLIFLLQDILLTASRSNNLSLDCLLNQHLNLTLSLNVLADGFIGDIACCRNQITVCPERGYFLELGKLTPEIVGAAPLESLDQFMYCHLRITGNEQVQVVGLYFQSQYLHLLFLGYLSKNHSQSIFNFIYKHWPPPLRAPDEVVVYEIDLICRMLIFHTVYSILLIYTSANTEKVGTPHSSPALKYGAF